MHPRYWLTWKRGDKLNRRWVIATFPFVLGLFGASIITIPLPWTDTFPVLTFVGGVVLSLLLCLWIYRFARSAGEVLYYPPLHKLRWLGISTVALEAVGIGITYLPYLVFLAPLNNSVIPPLPDIGIGLVLASGYVLFLSGWKSHVIRGDKELVAETEMAGRIRDALHQLQGDDPHFEDTDQLIEGLQTLAERCESEPLMASSSLPDTIRAWCDECAESNSLSSRLRMIPATEKPATSERTAQQRSRFRDLENDLHAMGIIDTPSEQ